MLKKAIKDINTFLEKKISKKHKHDGKKDISFFKKDWNKFKNGLNQRKNNNKLTRKAKTLRRKVLVKHFGKDWKEITNSDVEAQSRAAATYYACIKMGMSKKNSKNFSKKVAKANPRTGLKIIMVLFALIFLNQVMFLANKHVTDEMHVEEPKNAIARAFVRLVGLWATEIPASQSIRNFNEFVGKNVTPFILWIAKYLMAMPLLSIEAIKEIISILVLKLTELIGTITGKGELYDGFIQQNFPDRGVKYYTDGEGMTRNEKEEIEPFWEAAAKIWRDVDDWYENTLEELGYSNGGAQNNKTKRKNKRKNKTKRKNKRKNKRKKI